MYDLFKKIKVLIAGEYNNGVYLNSGAELYGPSTGIWTTVGTMNTARGYHVATTLPDGTVLVVAGYNNGVYVNSV